MFYLAMHSTYFIYGYMALDFRLWKEEMFYSILCDVGHMVKDHRDYVRGNLVPPLHGLLFLIQVRKTWRV